MITKVITSFNRSYYDRIGKYCVDTFDKYWPENIEMVCYTEDMDFESSKRVSNIDFSNMPTEYWSFQNSNHKSGVKKFAKKAYSIIHAMENLDADRLIWIDADCHTRTDFSHELIADLCPDDTLGTFMGVYHRKDGKTYFSAETGFFILNLNHIGFKSFAKRYRQYYDQNLAANLRRFYDGEVFGATVLDCKEFKFNDLTANFTKQYKTPLKRTILGQYLDHYKAKGTKGKFIANKILDE